MVIIDWLKSIPDSIFWKSDVGGDADYSAVQAHFMKHFYSAKTVDNYVADILTGRVPNLSSFQRSIAREAAKRRFEYQRISA